MVFILLPLAQLVHTTTTEPSNSHSLTSLGMRHIGRIDEKRSDIMSFKRAASASTLAAGIAITGLFGVGLATASADPWQGCDRPGAPSCNDHRNDRGPGQGDWNRGAGPVDWHGRGVDQGRFDHQPFNWNGQQVFPMPAGDGNGWGFWFLNQWIPL